MNNIMVAGRITKDAEIRQAGNDTVASFSVAENVKTKDGEKSQFFDCSLFGKRAEALCQYLTKGSPVTVTGTLTTREYNGKTYLQVRVGDVALHGGKRDGASNYGTSGAGNASKHRTDAYEFNGKDDPF